MRIAFAADIHGNAVALEEVLKDIQQRSVDKIIILGDICFRGPEPQRSLNLVRRLQTSVIKGNADEWLVRGIKLGEVAENSLEVMNKEREWTLSNLAKDDIQYLQCLPESMKLEIEGIRICAFHATPHSMFEIVPPDENEENLLKTMMVEEADIYVCAHIHKPYIKFFKGKCIINTGSVGLPFDGDKRASYTIMEVDSNFYQTSIIKVGYDVNNVIKQFNETDYPNKDLMIRLLKNAKT
ncbi:metallophosphoesterase family protein [Mesobacillus sp. AQ2]|uniref:metallophosphoesterase family protein n=1 Tax=Mesobacillus sp. AQ2 TaxID=3043332 RepID=UPI0024C1EAA3|nr:metallophosphoesterase family protein [Mesobacillus sp. AQ2]WHX41433.1 metallophosphoesterase family protein [Mesobacillus sp. AQ2]